MRPAFIITPDGEVASSLIPLDQAPTAFQVGELVTFDKALEMLPYAYVPQGAEFHVIAHSADTGLVELEATVPLEGLREWGQILTLIPFETEDALVALNGNLKLYRKCGVNPQVDSEAELLLLTT